MLLHNLFEHEIDKIQYLSGIFSGIDFLQKIPLDKCITENGDSGKPLVLSMPENSAADAYRRLAHTVMEFLDKQPVNNS